LVSGDTYKIIEKIDTIKKDKERNFPKTLKKKQKQDLAP
jgi:hypothetical protein